MASLQNQNISESFGQLLKTAGSSVTAGLQNITGGNDTATALQLSTTGVKSTGTLAVDGTSLLSGVVTFGTSLTASTGTATIGTLSASTATLSTATISTATISTSTISTATISTATISTATISTATISTATIPLQLGAITFGSSITASTGTATIGTLVATSETATNSTISNRITAGTYRVGASGPSIVNMSYGTASFSTSVVSAYNVAGTTNGTVALTGVQLGDIVTGSLDSLGTVNGSTGLILGFHPIATNVVRYSIANPTTTAGSVPSGTFYMTAMRITA